MGGAVQAGALVINMAADVATLKTTMAEGVRVIESSSQKMAADLAGIRKGFESALDPLKNLTVNVGSLEGNLGKAQSAALSLAKGLLIGAAAGMSIDSFKNKIFGVIDGMANLKTISEKTGSSVENLSKLNFFAKQSGSDIDAVSGALGKLSKGMAGADNDSKGAGQALKFLGLSAKDAEGNLKDPSVMFTEIAKKLVAYEDGAGKVAIAQALLGKSGADMLPTLKLIGEQGDIEAKVTTAQADAARQYQRDLAKLDAQKGMLFKTVATALLPTMSDFTNVLLSASKNTNIVNGSVKDLANDRSLEEWADNVAMGLALVVDTIKLMPSLFATATSGFKEVGAAAKIAVLSLPGTMVMTKAAGGNPIDNLKAALKEEEETYFDYGKKISELLNREVDSTRKAMQAKIDARHAARDSETKDAGGVKSDPKKDKLNFNTSGEDGGENKTYKASLVKQEGLFKLEEEALAQHLQVLDSQRARALVGDFQYLDQRYALEKAALAEELGIRQKQLAAAQADPKTNAKDVEVYSAGIKQLNARGAALDIADAERRAALEHTVQQEIAGIDAEAMKKRGDVVGAFTEDFSKRYSDMMTKAQLDGNTELIAAIERAWTAGTAEANFSKVKSQYEAALSGMSNEIEQVQQTASADGGILSRINADGIASAIRGKALPALQDFVAQMQVLAAGSGNDALVKQANDLAKSLSKEAGKTEAAWNDSIRNIADEISNSFADAFGNAGRAAGNFFKVYADGLIRQDALKKQMDNLSTMKDDDPAKVKQLADTRQALAASQLKSYGDMAVAAKGFFNENSKGYKVLGDAEKAFRAFELANQMQKLATSLFVSSASATGVVAGKAVETGAVLTGEATQNAAKVPGVFMSFMSAMGPWGAAAAAVAIAAVLGGAFSGGGGGVTAKQRQETQGTGSVFGDSSAKSDSLSKSIELAASNSSIELTHTAGMLASLRNIESSLSGLGNLLVRTSGLTGSVAPDGIGGAEQTFNSILGNQSLGEKLSGGLLGKVVNGIFGGRTSVTDTGFTVGATSLAGVLSSGVTSKQYTDTHKDGGIFHSDSNDTTTTALGAAADAQFAKVILGLAGSVTEAGKLLGLGGDAFTAHLNQFVVDIGKISLKDLKGDDIQAALEAVFSKLGDDMAQFGVAGLEQFQKVGEGYFETLTRVATDYANLNSIMESIGTTFGATGMASIAAREHLIDLAGGLDQLASQTSSFASNFLSQAEQLAPVQKYVTDQLAAMGLQGIDTRDKFKGVVMGLANSGALATEAGAQQYTALLALADAFAKTHAATVDLTKSEQDIADERKDLVSQRDQLTMTSVQLLAQERAAIDASNLAIFDQVHALQALKDANDAVATAQSTLLDAYNKQKSALQSVVDLQLAAAAATQKQIDAMNLGTLSTLSPEQKYLEAQRQFDNAAPGDAKNSAAQALLEASRAYNGSTDAYTKDYAKVKSALVLQAASQKSAATIAQDQLAALDKQVGQLIDISAGVTTLNATMVGLQNAILGLGTALQNQSAAQAAAGKPSDAAAGQGKGAIDSMLTGIYKDQLGRAPDAGGLKYWEDAVAGGQNYQQIVASFQNSDEYKYIHGSHANGLEFVPFDGYRAELHRGERVQTSSQVTDDKKANAAIVQLLQDLVTEARADKPQRAAAVEATVGGIVKELRSLKTATKQSAQRASAEVTT